MLDTQTTARTIVADLYDLKPNAEPEEIAEIAFLEIEAHENRASIIMDLLTGVARQMYRNQTAALEAEVERTPVASRFSLSRARKVKRDTQGRTIAAKSAVEQLLGRTVYVPGQGQVVFQFVTSDGWKRRAAFMEGQLDSYTVAMKRGITFIGNIVYFLEKNRIDTIAEYPDFTPELIPGFSAETLEEMSK